jgi:multiple sugar transport system ATP-binding protein
MSEGRLHQVDTPDVIYENPATLFVARFIGSPKMNVVPAQLTTADGTPVVSLLGMTVPVERGRLLPGASSGHVVAGIRPEDLAWNRFGGGEHTFAATVDLVEPMGPEVYVSVKAGESELISRFPPRCGVQPGDTVELELHPDRLHLFDPRSEQSLLTPQLVSERVSTPGTRTASAAPVDGS